MPPILRPGRHLRKEVAALAQYNPRSGGRLWIEEDTVVTERTLWDFLDDGAEREKLLEQADKAETRRRVFKGLRSSGHWLNLLRVARTIPQPFTLNDISVAVWKSCPEFFGMKGYPYPDNHKVHYILYGDRGLIAKGLIRRVEQGLFRVPEDLDLEALLASPKADDHSPNA
jgi:hypothetical protein